MALPIDDSPPVEDACTESLQAKNLLKRIQQVEDEFCKFPVQNLAQPLLTRTCNHRCLPQPLMREAAAVTPS